MVSSYTAYTLRCTPPCPTGVTCTVPLYQTTPSNAKIGFCNMYFTEKYKNQRKKLHVH